MHQSQYLTFSESLKSARFYAVFLFVVEETLGRGTTHKTLCYHPSPTRVSSRLGFTHLLKSPLNTASTRKRMLDNKIIKLKDNKIHMIMKHFAIEAVFENSCWSLIFFESLWSSGGDYLLFNKLSHHKVSSSATLITFQCELS